jgi:YfiH family protein
LKHGFFTRQGGCSQGLYSSLNCGLGSGDDPLVVRKNRAFVAETLGVPSDKLVTLYQHHSPDVVIVSEPWEGDNRPKADGLATRVAGLALGVLTADCAPVLFADAEAGVIGAAHAGWKGALTGVTDQTILAMEQLGARRENINVVIGPTISQSSYEVGPDFRERFVAIDSSLNKWFRPSTRPFHHMFDLPGYLSERLIDLGVSHVENLSICTYSDKDRFFSYRRTTHMKERDYGRQISAITLIE